MGGDLRLVGVFEIGGRSGATGLVGRERISGFGCRESVPSFAEAAKEIRTCLRAYEALRGREDLDLAELSARTDLLPKEALRPWERKPGHERAHLFGVLGRMVQMRLSEHCYPQFNIYTRGGHPTGSYALTYGFHGLLGAIWIQMAWLLESEGRRVRFCKLPDCRRVVSFEPGEDLDADPDAEAHGKRKTRKDRVFCKGGAASRDTTTEESKHGQGIPDPERRTNYYTND